MVIQKYLRNEFETIEDYNAEAGEVAEPFRYLVVANFPANFSEAACRRLVSIVSSGARCGVYTLISVDTKMQMPQGFKLSDLEQHCVNFIWKDDHFQWKDEDFGALPLMLDKPPAVDLFTQIVRTRRRKRQERQQGGSARSASSLPRPRSGGKATRAAAFAFRSARPAPPSSNTWSWAKALRSTCWSPVRRAPVNRRCCTR